MPTLTMGLDLAARPTSTAVCLLSWQEDGAAEVVELARGRSASGDRLDDGWLVATAAGPSGGRVAEVTKVGIDDPFGWPEPFLDALSSYHRGSGWPSGIDEPRDAFRLRETDRLVHARTAKWPLSVAADRIAIPAMRCAVLLTEIGRRRGAETVARDGSGLCCEVYPDPALRLWTKGSRADLGGASYKGADNADRRRRLLAALLELLPLRDDGDLLSRVALEDDYLDALVCALVARAAELGLTLVPEDERQASLAATEGWIHLPDGSLHDLAAAGSRR